jgi:hypothetical protein
MDIEKIIEVADDAYTKTDDHWCIKYGEQSGGYKTVMTKMILSLIAEAERKAKFDIVSKIKQIFLGYKFRSDTDYKILHGILDKIIAENSEATIKTKEA